MHDVDLLVIGSGSGLDVANAAVHRGESVAIVEEGPLGGTCLNRGCIPSKMLLYHAEILTQIERADAFHIDATVDGFDVPRMVNEVNAEVAEDADSIRAGLHGSEQHVLLEGRGKFVGNRHLEMVSGPDAGAEVRGETVLIAAGSRPKVPRIDGIHDVPFMTSDEALRLETPPDHLVIVGGGYIAAELGHFFGTFGSEISIIGRRPHLLPETDPEIGREFTDRYSERFSVYTGYEAIVVSETKQEICVEAAPYAAAAASSAPGVDRTDPGEAPDVTIEGDVLLLAAGRQPNTDTLNVEATGVETDDAGFVETDEYLRTSADGIWALGDIVGEYLLKHNANHEAHAVIRNRYGDEMTPVNYDAMPYAVFSHPEVAGVGVTESTLRSREIQYGVRTYAFAHTGRGSAMKVDGTVKVLIGPDGRILGCHIIGPEASNLIQEAVVAMTAGSGTVHDIRDAIHIHPALSEVVQRAFAGAFEWTEGSES